MYEAMEQGRAEKLMEIRVHSVNEFYKTGLFSPVVIGNGKVIVNTNNDEIEEQEKKACTLSNETYIQRYL